MSEQVQLSADTSVLYRGLIAAQRFAISFSVKTEKPKPRLKLQSWGKEIARMEREKKAVKH